MPFETNKIFYYIMFHLIGFIQENYESFIDLKFYVLDIALSSNNYLLHIVL